MFDLRIRTPLCGAVIAVFAFSAAAFSQENQGFTANIGAGYTSITGRLANDLTNGWNIGGAAGYNFNQHLGILGTFMFNDLGVTNSALNRLNMPNGTSRIYTLTADPKLSFPLGRGSFYVLAGGGWMKRTVEFTQPVLAQTFVFDPWFGYFGPALIPANQVIGSVTNNGGVWDVGGGFNFPLPNTRAKLYVEARYYDGFTSVTHTRIVPLSFGIRW